MPYEQIQSNLQAEEDRRKRIRESLLQNQLNPMQSAGGRAIPISPFQALASGLKTYTGGENIRASEAESDRLRQQQTQEKTAARQKVLEALRGQKPDYMDIALQTTESPYTENMTDIVSQKLKADTGRGSYNVVKDVTVGGKTFPITFDTRTREAFYMDGRPFTGQPPEIEVTSPRYDPKVQAGITGAKKTAELGAERSYTMSGIGDVINRADMVMSGLETGVTPTESGIGAVIVTGKPSVA